MTFLQAIVLAIVQGLTEFLPISSSGHLLVIPWFFGWQDASSLTYDVMLHAGTMVAIIVYFWNDWKGLIAGSLHEIRSGRFGRELNSRMLIMILLACIPAGVVGLKFDDVIETKFRTMYMAVGIVMIGMGVILYIADRIGRKDRPVEKTSPADAAVIGIAQALALFPGVSRSGSTITAGMFMGLTREAAARFSFLLASPVILGASLYKLLKLAKQIAAHQPLDTPIGLMILGLVVSAVVGYIAIAGLLKYLRNNSMLPFVIYRLVFGLLIIAVSVFRG